MCLPHASASNAIRRPRLAARSPSSWKSRAARSMPPRESGDTLPQIIRRSQPSSAIRSNLRSARENAFARSGSGIPSKSRNGWKVTAARPRSLILRPTCAGAPSNDNRSFSKISTPLKRAAAIASSFSLRVPLRQTVAMAVCNDVFLSGGSLVARMERSAIRDRLTPDYAEFIIGPAGGRTRWLHPGYGLRTATSFAPLTLAQCLHGLEVPDHALCIRFAPGEQPERPRGLEHRHAAARHGAAAAPTGGTKELGLGRKIDDLRNPQVRPQKLASDRHSGVVRHADRGGVDDAVGRIDGRRNVARRDGAALAEAVAQARREPVGARRLGVDDRDLANAEREQRMGNRGPGPPGAEQHHSLSRHVGKLTPEALGEARPVGVVPDEAAIGREDDGIHRPERACMGRQPVEERNDRLFTGMGDVEAGEGKAAGRHQELGQGLDSEAENLKIDEPVDISEALGGAFALMQRRHARGLDARANEP